MGRKAAASLTPARQITAGYSGTPLPRKLGLKGHQNIALRGVPAEVAKELPIPADTRHNLRQPLDFVLLFAKSQTELKKSLPKYAAKLAPSGMLWVAWLKRSSGVPTDLSENIIRDIGLAAKLVDVKVCAITEIWSGLKFVIRRKDRGERHRARREE